MICSKCGSLASDNEKFCCRCGSEIMVQTEHSEQDRSMGVVTAIIITFLIMLLVFCTTYVIVYHLV